MTDVMLDLETLSTAPDAAIVAIGAVRFDAGGVTDRFEAAIDLDDALRHGRVDGRTLRFWLFQSREAREATFVDPAFGLRNALARLNAFVGDVPVWGNGAAFDNAIVSHAYASVGLDRSWSYRNDRCYRTVRALAPFVEAGRVGTTHRAVDDAETQARHLLALGVEPS